MKNSLIVNIIVLLFLISYNTHADFINSQKSVLQNSKTEKNHNTKIKLKWLNKKLIKAVKKGETEQVKELLAKGADVNAKDKGSLWISIIKYLCEAITDECFLYPKDWTALMWAVGADHNEIVQLLLDNGANVNVRAGILNMTALVWAVTLKNKKAVQLLLDVKKIDVNTQDNIGETALMKAITNGDLEIVKSLIEKGADVNIKAKYATGYTALMLASLEPDIKIIKLLIKKGADVNANEGAILPWALTSSKNKELKKIVKLLIEKGADIKGKNGRLALIKAVEKDYTEIARFLIKKRADVNVKNKDGMTALKQALKNKNSEMINILKQAGAVE